MNFNYKESINKIKNQKIKYAIEQENTRLIKSYHHDSNMYDTPNPNSINKRYMYKQIVPKIELGNFILPLKIPPPIIRPDKHSDYISKNFIKIVNVYQLEYNNNVKPTGFGDFIRGCYFLIQFCEKYNIKYDVQINHPIHKYLKLYSNNNKKEESKEVKEQEVKQESKEEQEVKEDLQIIKFDKTNFHPDNPSDQNKYEIIDEFCSYLKELTIENKIAYVYVISFHFEIIKEEQKDYIRRILEPSNDFKINIINEMKSMNLVFKNYIVIHIRAGDNMLFYDETINNEYLKNIFIEIYKIYKPQYNYLLISDSVNLKKKIINLFPKFKVSFKEITHFGEGQELENEKIKNTLLDFYLMSYSGRIYSYSCYEHGTGFSRWCAETYNIPYKCYVIK
jgi:hypothetical protein